MKGSGQPALLESLNINTDYSALPIKSTARSSESDWQRDEENKHETVTKNKLGESFEPEAEMFKTSPRANIEDWLQAKQENLQHPELREDPLESDPVEQELLAYRSSDQHD